MSPAAMYSLARSTMPMNSSGVVLETGGRQGQLDARHAGGVRQRLVERRDDLAQALDGGGIGFLRVDARLADRPA